MSFVWVTQFSFVFTKLRLIRKFDLAKNNNNITFYSVADFVNNCQPVCIYVCVCMCVSLGTSSKIWTLHSCVQCLWLPFYCQCGCLYIYLSCSSFSHIASHVWLGQSCLSATMRSPVWLTLHVTSLEDTECKVYSIMIWCETYYAISINLSTRWLWQGMLGN